MRTPPQLLVRLLALLLVAALFGPTGSATAQTANDAFFFSQRSPATGARLSGLAGTSLAGVGDYASVYTNPAGLGWLDQSQAAGTFRTLLVTNEADYATIFSDTNNDGFIDFDDSPVSNVTDQTRTGYGIANAGLAYKFPTTQGSLVLAIALNETRNFDRGTDFRNQNQLSSVTDFFLPIGNEVGVQQFADGAAPELLEGQRLFDAENADYILDFDPDGNGRVNRPLSLAAYDAFAINFAPDLFQDGASAAESFVPLFAPGTQFRQVGDISESGTLRELNFGGAVETAPGVMLGLSANVAFGRYEFRSVFEEIDEPNTGQNAIDLTRLTRQFDSDLAGFNLRLGLSADLVPDRVRGGFTIETPTWYAINETSSLRIESVFDDNAQFSSMDETGRTELDYELRTPWRIGVGLSGQVTPGLRLSGDATFVDWTTLKLDESVEDFGDDNRLIEDEYEPVVHLRGGAEYTIDGLSLRGGVAFQPDPTGGTATSGDRLYLSGGLGYAFSDELALNVSYLWQQFDGRFAPYGGAFPVEEDVRRSTFLVGLSYSF